MGPRAIRVSFALHSRMNDYFVDAKGNGLFGSYGQGTFSLYDYPRASPSSNYPITIYHKGASVMGMLRWSRRLCVLCGDAVLRGEQIRQRDDGLYQQAMDSISHQDLSWFFNEWVYKAGWPDLNVGFHLADSLYVTIVQTQDTTKYPLFTMPVEIGIVNKDSITTTQRIQMAAVDSQVIGVPLPPGGVMSVSFDPNFRLLSQNTVSALTPVEEIKIYPTVPFLLQNFLKPVAESYSTNVTIDGQIYAEGIVRLGLYDLLGRLVRDYTPVLSSKARIVNLDVSGLTAGVYYYRLDTSRAVYANCLTITR